MKIVQLLPELNEGGVERGVVDLSRELVKRGFESVVISAGGKLVDQILSDGGAHFRLDVASKNPLSVPYRVFQLLRLLKKIDPDIVHVRSRVPAWLFYFANTILKKPVVSTVHGFNSVSGYSKIMTRADQVICGSSFMIEHIVKHYDTPREKITLIPRGMDGEYFNAHDIDKKYTEQLIEKYHLTHNKVLVQIARITHWKDQLTTIKAFALVKQEYPNVKLLFVGGYQDNRESYYGKLQELVKSYHLENDIFFVGHTNKIKEILSIADLNISSSFKPETFGRANVEGMFLGVPLVGTNIGATSDYIIEGKTGYFFTPQNDEELKDIILKSLMTQFDKSFIQRFSNENFSLEQMVVKNIEVYTEVIHVK
jgi:glycosyltransferase involved in cell wall biosynthesis